MRAKRDCESFCHVVSWSSNSKMIISLNITTKVLHTEISVRNMRYILFCLIWLCIPITAFTTEAESKWPIMIYLSQPRMYTAKGMAVRSSALVFDNIFKMNHICSCLMHVSWLVLTSFSLTTESSVTQIYYKSVDHSWHEHILYWLGYNSQKRKPRILVITGFFRCTDHSVIWLF